MQNGTGDQLYIDKLLLQEKKRTYNETKKEDLRAGMD